MKMTLPDDVSHIILTLEEKGYEAYAVGGCVRDAMLGREPEDWDITTSARPVTIKETFPRTIDTGIQHGTVTVMYHHVGYEVTTYRIDGEYEDGRHPKDVEFTTNLKMDLERRDFTINAMAYNDTVGLVDEFEGIEDLHRHVIRCVGDAGQRFDEDALRMLRAVRFSGQLGFTIEEQTRQAIVERASHLDKISAERIRVEMTKLLISPGAGQIREAIDTGMTSVFLPELDRMMGCEQCNPHHIFTVGEHSIRSVEIMNEFFDETALKQLTLLQDASREKIYQVTSMLSKKQHIMLVVTMLLHDVGKPDTKTIDSDGMGHFKGHPQVSETIARQILRRLTFDNETTDTVKRLIRWHDYRFEATPKHVRRAASRIGRDIMWMELLVQYADILAQNPTMAQEKLDRVDQAWKLFTQIEEARQPLAIKDLAVSGADLIAAGMQPGPQLGQTLQSLLEKVIEEPSLNNKEQLLLIVGCNIAPGNGENDGH